MMMSIGQFVFSLTTLAYQDLQRQTSWRHAANSRVGARPARQFLGPGDDTITLSGMVAMEFSNGIASLEEIRTMADTGKAWPLVDGAGYVYGQWVVEGLNTTNTLFLANGVPRRVEFQISLTRVDDNLTDTIQREDE